MCQKKNKVKDENPRVTFTSVNSNKRSHATGTYLFHQTYCDGWDQTRTFKAQSLTSPVVLIFSRTINLRLPVHLEPLTFFCAQPSDRNSRSAQRAAFTTRLHVDAEMEGRDCDILSCREAAAVFQLLMPKRKLQIR